MAPISPGHVVRPSRSKKTNLSSNTHRFESFTNRISRLKIDPLHNTTNKISSTDTDLSQSFFRTALQEWSELNLSSNFTNFLAAVTSLCESLPQLIHHAGQIFEFLLEHIQKEDELGLEPLLSLLAHFAHDLGQNFEKYFAQTVTVVAQVAASHSSFEVIEWCFTCLAWMFKYLSRLLVEDMRPLLDIVKPYLAAKKQYIARFMAESLSFLLRKAAILYSKRKRPLELVMEKILQILEESSNEGEAPSHQNGLMTLLVETAAGIEGNLHSCASNLFRCTINIATKPSKESSIGQQALEGVLIGLIYRTERLSLVPIIQIINEKSHDVEGKSSLSCKTMLNLLNISIATSKGSKIVDWKNTIEAFVSLCPTESSPHWPQDRSMIISTSAMILQYAPMDQLLPLSDLLLDKTTEEMPPHEFFSYCSVVAGLGRQRFEDFLLPRLQSFILLRWAENELGLCYLLEHMSRQQKLPLAPNNMLALNIPQEWQKSVLEKLSNITFDLSTFSDEEIFTTLTLTKLVQFEKNDEIIESLQKLIQDLVSEKETGAEPDFPPKKRMLLGLGFQAYLMQLRQTSANASSLLPAMVKLSPKVFQLLPFLNALDDLLHFKSETSSWKVDDLKQALKVLVDNLLTNSVSLRKTSLHILSGLIGSEAGAICKEAIGISLEIMDVSYNPSNARRIAMLLRQLPQRQKHIEQLNDEWYVLKRIIPFFCIGLLPQYHEQLRQDLSSVLAEMATSIEVETMILDVIIDWFRKPSQSQSPSKTLVAHKANRLSSFQSWDVIRIRQKSIEAVREYTKPSTKFRELFEQEHAIHSSTTPTDSRHLALQFFSHLPKLAEKRSRLLTPIFLASEQMKTSLYLSSLSETSESSHTLTPDLETDEWSTKDRLAFLSLLAQFANLKAIYRSEEVYQTITTYLSNGNAEMRKLAVQALCNWKDSNLKRYDSMLVRVAEEKSVSVEVMSMLGTDSEYSEIEGKDRSIVLPVLIRLLFGHLLGGVRTHGSLESRRKSILRALFRMQPDEIGIFLNLALGGLVQLQIPWTEPDKNNIWSTDVVSIDQQYGFLRMMLLILETIQSQFARYAGQLLEPILYCLLRSCRLAESANHTSEVFASASMVRNARKTGFQCLSHIFEYCPGLEWHLFLPGFFREAVSPRLEAFASENAQTISGLLRIFSKWARSPALMYALYEYDSRLLPAVWSCISTNSAQKIVQKFVLEEILSPLIESANQKGEPSNKAETILEGQMSKILDTFIYLLKTSLPKDVFLCITALVPDLSRLSRSSKEKEAMRLILMSILSDKSQKTSPREKSTTLTAINSLLEPGELNLDMQIDFYQHISSLFAYFKDFANRTTLCQILMKLGPGNDRLQPTIAICSNLNAVSTDHLDEVDFDRRSEAINTISSLELSDSLQWLPIIYNLIYFVIDDDFSIRSNAVSCLKRFITKACASENPEFPNMVAKIILPAIQKDAGAESEVVRADVVSIYGVLVEHLGEECGIHELKGLLVSNDEEASFFSNILHIQQHRRIRAIRRLVTETEKGVISSSSLSNFFIPLLDKFIYKNDTEENMETMKGQSMMAMSVLLKWLDWKAFKIRFRQYKQSLGVDDLRNINVKLLRHAADALFQAWNEKYQTFENPLPRKLNHLGESLPSQEVTWTELKTNFIPFLADFIHYKNETELSFRVPAANICMKLIKMLPSEETSVLAAPVLLDVTQILRSRAFESREVARKALCEIVVLLGPTSIHFVLREMKHALTRGYQLHVLSYSLHSILVSLVPDLTLGALDYCLKDLVSVALEDLFGRIGEEKDNTDYVSTMKEVKSSKSLDTVELLSSVTSVVSLVNLVAPIELLSSGNLTTKQSRKVDEVLRRIGLGLARNSGAGSRDLLVFAYQIVQRFYQSKSGIEPMKLTNDEENRKRFFVQLSSFKKASTGAISSPVYKLVRFALDIVRSTFQKHETLLTPENVHGFLPIIGDVLLTGQEDTKISALRLLSSLIKLPMPELDENIPMYWFESVKVVQSAISTNDEIAQAALKFMGAVLRERKIVSIKENDVADLLHRITPDIEEPERQGVTFNFIKAVMTRKIEVPQLYDLMDKIGVIMVTNHGRGARDVARGIYVHFLLTYPQSASRWSKQQKFLMKNLEYSYPEGRQSIMEAVHTLCQKLKGETAEQFVVTFSVPIMLRMSSDENERCRDVAGTLLSHLFNKAGPSQLRTLLESPRSWIEQTENRELTKLGLLTYGIFLDTVHELAKREINHLLGCVSQIVSFCLVEVEEWELCYQALQILSKLVTLHPSLTLIQDQQPLWQLVIGLLDHQHFWIQDTVSALLSIFLQDCVSSNLAKVPLTCAHGLYLDRDAIIAILRSSMRIMKRTEDHDQLRQTVVAILVFLGGVVDQNGLDIQLKARSEMNNAVLEMDSIQQTNEDGYSSNEEEKELIEQQSKVIPAIQYVLDQTAYVLRREATKLTTSALLPKQSALKLLQALIPQLSTASMTRPIVLAILLPLRHLTDPSTIAPHSADPTFPTTYQDLVSNAQEVMEIIHQRLGDSEYVKAMTEVSKIARERREERRTKRRIEKVTEPEKVAQTKRRKGEKKKERKKEIVGMYRQKRRER